MKYIQVSTGGDRNFAYVVWDEESGEGFIVDPSYTPDKVFQVAEENGIKIKYVLNTHSHFDHSNGNEEFEQLCGVKAVAYGESEPLTGNRIDHNVKLPLGNTEITILHTPGHTPDSICIYAGNAVFTGDTLFVGKVGGTGFGDDAKEEYGSLHNILGILPDDTRVFPGHDVGVTPSSTMGEEKSSNPFYLQPDFESFVYLKQTWLEYKKKHGIA